jgi:hypothetical protein
LRKLDYHQPIIVTMDTSLIKIEWVIKQEGVEGYRNPIHFGTNILNEQ